MYQLAYAVLWAAGLLVNLRHPRILLLTAMVGASVFLPVPHDSAESFYMTCIMVDFGVGIAAWSMATAAGALIADICVLLVIAHVMGYALDGGLPFSPYRVIVKILEVSQLVACVALSPTLAPILRNQNATTT